MAHLAVHVVRDRQLPFAVRTTWWRRLGSAVVVWLETWSGAARRREGDVSHTRDHDAGAPLLTVRGGTSATQADDRGEG